MVLPLLYSIRFRKREKKQSSLLSFWLLFFFSSVFPLLVQLAFSVTCIHILVGCWPSGPTLLNLVLVFHSNFPFVFFWETLSFVFSFSFSSLPHLMIPTIWAQEYSTVPRDLDLKVGILSPYLWWLHQHKKKRWSYTGGRAIWKVRLRSLSQIMTLWQENVKDRIILLQQVNNLLVCDANILLPISG